jgi:hypothetical protein
MPAAVSPGPLPAHPDRARERRNPVGLDDQRGRRPIRPVSGGRRAAALDHCFMLHASGEDEGGGNQGVYYFHRFSFWVRRCGVVLKTNPEGNLFSMFDARLS